MNTELMIRPAYHRGCFVGFALHNGSEPIGKVFAQYKHCAMLWAAVTSVRS